jgi:mRNA (guanine-N7-)-methyltransferase
MNNAERHYDRQASAPKGGPPRSALQKFHNDAKRALLSRFVGMDTAILDLACGRGGDIHKWHELGVMHVTGLDISGKSIEEARNRYSKTEGRARSTYLFQQADLSLPWTGEAEYGVATCMFALHYFFKNEATARTLLRTVASNLKPGGYFIGIVPCGQQINECIRNGAVFDNGVMRVAALWEGPPQCFGSPYTCTIHGTVTQDSAVPEYLVYANVLEQLAHEHGLTPVPLHHAYFAAGRVFHLLNPPYAGEYVSQIEWHRNLRHSTSQSVRPECRFVKSGDAPSQSAML